MTHSAGIHHVTSICGDPKRNYDFYTGALGLRFIKKTVNFDDPGTYHLYYGDEQGSPGTALTFFPWAGSPAGRAGSGETLATAFMIADNSVSWWQERLTSRGLNPKLDTRFGQIVVAFRDPDAIGLELVAVKGPLPGKGYAGAGVPAEHAIRGFHSVTLGLGDVPPTAKVLTHVFGWQLTATEGARSRYSATADSKAVGGCIDLVETPGAPAHQGVGSVHHIAFRAASDADQSAMVEALRPLGIAATEQKDRFYFRSVYFREPGRVLFEIATDTPGFTVDESLETLGTALKLPPRYEAMRARIEAALPAL